MARLNEKGFVFDGVPQNVNQAIFLDDLLKTKRVYNFSLF